MVQDVFSGGIWWGRGHSEPLKLGVEIFSLPGVTLGIQGHARSKLHT